MITCRTPSFICKKRCNDVQNIKLRRVYKPEDFVERRGKSKIGFLLNHDKEIGD